jgi:competence protein CoiA
MKLAFVNGEKTEATSGAKGVCPSCGSELVAKCGEVKVHHWAHKGNRNCDSWWENETEWHRAWKGQFPLHWQEFVHKAENGEKHIADVKTDQGWVIEFQRSYLNPEERRSRDNFYPKLVWVVDGTRRKRDEMQFFNALEKGMPVGRNPYIRRTFSDKCTLLREWEGSPSPIFFDFGKEALWWLVSRNPKEPLYLSPFSRTDFIGIHRGGTQQKTHDFEAFVKDSSELFAKYESNLRNQASKRASQQRLWSLQRDARRNKRRRRL